MNKNTLFFIFLSVLAGLNVASIRKAEDPIRDTQTNPILYEQKKEEEKEGKKGPLLYSVKHNPKEDFFIEPPYEKSKDAVSQEDAIQATAEPIEAGGWWEEPAGPQASSGEFIEESPEKYPSEEQEIADSDRDSDIKEEPLSEPSKEDYWW
ncbi:MAG TPA: hypothetical protein P5561_01390 [Candidatus Omnitrophota bacterium]|nr:hypothetical protein [Candidatus Omnitrophota bacterium]HRY85166.1 hypothetical protein [Candidatus Omnitrophota bacterium]